MCSRRRGRLRGGRGGGAVRPLHGESERWAVVRSLSKVVGPDLRIALVAGDAITISRLEGRQVLGPGWVSHLLQQTAAQLLASASTRKLLARTERTYAERRSTLVDALAERGIEAQGDSGLGVWVPLAEEAATVQLLLERGWAVSPGERYRFRTPPWIRVTTTALKPRTHESSPARWENCATEPSRRTPASRRSAARRRAPRRLPRSRSPVPRPSRRSPTTSRRFARAPRRALPDSSRAARGRRSLWLHRR